jgi:hypothetical protein
MYHTHTSTPRISAILSLGLPQRLMYRRYIEYDVSSRQSVEATPSKLAHAALQLEKKCIPDYRLGASGAVVRDCCAFLTSTLLVRGLTSAELATFQPQQGCRR